MSLVTAEPRFGRSHVKAKSFKRRVATDGPHYGALLGPHGDTLGTILARPGAFEETPACRLSRRSITVRRLPNPNVR